MELEYKGLAGRERGAGGRGSWGGRAHLVEKDVLAVPSTLCREFLEGPVLADSVLLAEL